MAKSIHIILFAILLTSGCTMHPALQTTPTANMTQTEVITPLTTTGGTRPGLLGVTPTPTNISFHTVNPEPSPGSIPPNIIHPAIHEISGDLYVTLFQIPIDSTSVIQYEYGPSAIEGPLAIAILPDQSFLIADPIGGRLLNYDPQGQLVHTLEFAELGIGYVRDMRIKTDEIFLLETSYQKFYLHRLLLDGKLIASEEIPYTFPIDPDAMDHTIENSLSGIAIDCEGNILLEVWGGSNLLHLVDVQRQPDLDDITTGYSCDGNIYQVNNPQPGGIPQLIAGSMIYETSLTVGLGGLSILDVFPDGGVYIERVDVMDGTPIQVDLTVHFVGAGGVVKGIARLPISEYYYSIHRKLAIGYDGEVYALLPRPDSLDVVRLNFYSALEPLLPGAAIPQLVRSP